MQPKFKTLSIDEGDIPRTLRKTSVPEILQIDFFKTDMFLKQEASPTYLDLDPYCEERSVEITIGTESVSTSAKLSEGRFLGLEPQEAWNSRFHKMPHGHWCSFQPAKNILSKMIS